MIITTKMLQLHGAAILSVRKNSLLFWLHFLWMHFFSNVHFLTLIRCGDEILARHGLAWWRRRVRSIDLLRCVFLFVPFVMNGRGRKL